VKIHPEVEPVVREAFAASVAEEAERFDQALEDVVRRGDDFARTAVSLAIVIDSATLLTLHEDQPPDDDQLRPLAHDFVESQTWLDDVQEDAVLSFLHFIAHGEPRVQDILPLADIAQISFALGGWLLSAYLPEGKDWTDLLDEVLDRLEATPADA